MMEGRRVTVVDRTGRSRLLTGLGLAGMVVLYLCVALAVAYMARLSGNFKDGADTMFYVHRGELLYRSITQDGNWFPILDLSWYNGVQTWRYWSPMSAYILAGCQALTGGSSDMGFLLFIGLLYMACALVWLGIGCSHGRPWMGAVLGLIWFLVPHNVFMFFGEGVLARSISLPAMPIFFVALHDYLHERRRGAPLAMLLSFLFIILCHVGWAGMVAISVLFYLVFYFILTRKAQRVGIMPVILSIVLAFLISGVFLVPSLIGGITGIDSSSVMASHFQSLTRSLSLFLGLSEGVWNRFRFLEIPYFGMAALLLCVLGILCARRDSRWGFYTSVLILLLTTPTAYLILIHMPGSQYLWMSRFMSIALCILLVSFFFWLSLKRKWQVSFLLLFTVEILCATVMISHAQQPLSPNDVYDSLGRAMLIDQGKAITTQRMTVMDPYGKHYLGIYVGASHGEDTKPTSYGYGIQAASDYTNLIQLNQALEDEQYLYLFDRALELGNDTLIVPLDVYKGKLCDAQALQAAAGQVGYRLVEENQYYHLYHIDTPDTFGVVSKYRAISIGSGAGTLALGFPAVEETTNIYLDDYTYEELSQYDVIYLAGFSYHHLPTAEELILRLSENGVRVVILADGIPADEHTGSKSFLGVSCNTVNFQNGYPALDTIDGVLYCDLFASGYSKDWKTVYLNGLSDVWGTITDVPEGRMDFYGTGKNENLVYIGLAMTYHYALTQDPAVGMLLSHALTISPQELPQRELVPISVDYRDNVITIESPKDDVNTTLAFQDIFDADRPVEDVNNLAVVGAGRTVIRLRYPYFAIGLSVSTVGVVLSACYLALVDRRIRASRSRQKEEDGSQEPASEEKA